MKPRDTKARYKLMRKAEGTNWRTCGMSDYEGRKVPRAVTDDKLIAIKNRDYMQREFPNEEYAILELN